jgi:hypothetical protein
VTAIALIRSRGLCGRGWSLVALALCLAAVALSFAVTSSDQGIFDWRWWLLGFPVGACVGGVLLPVRNVLIGSAIVMASFCVVASLSIGIFFVPSFAAIVLAISRTQRS